MKRLIVALVAVVAGNALAVDALYTNPNGIDHAWAVAGNWTVDGQTPAEPPTNAEDNVTFDASTTTSWPQRRVHLGTDRGAGNARSFTVNSVYGTMAHMLMNTYTWSSGVVAGKNVVTVRNPNGFTGFWGAGDNRATYRFPASETFTPEIRNLDIQGRLLLDAGDTGKAKVDATYDPGVLETIGAAEVELGGTIGNDAHIYLTKGSVTLAGHAADDTIESVIDKAYLHLDASVDSTLERVEGSETSITNWLDVRGNGMSAHLPTLVDLSGYGNDRIKVPSAPFIADEVSPTGLQLLDFGSCHKDGTEPLYGPTNCCLAFSRITNGTEVFVVTRYHAAISMNAVLGDRNDAPLQPYGGAYLGGSANRLVRSGMGLRDGYKILTADNPADGLTNLTVMSYGPTTNLTVCTIAVDQLYPARAGGMLIGEVLIFTNAISTVDRQRIHNYLKHKWLTGDAAAAVADAGTVLFDNQGGDAVSIGVKAGRTARVMNIVAGPDNTIVKTGDGALVANGIQPTNAVLDVRGGSLSVTRFASAVSDTDIAPDPLVRLDASAPGTVLTEPNLASATNFVTVWKDCRVGVDIAAVPFSKDADSTRPVMAAARSATGLPAVDFAYKSASMTLPWYMGAARVYGGFAVIRQIDRSHVPFFGCSNMALERENTVGGQHARLLHNNYPHPAAASALWTVNGRPVDPIVYMPEYFDSSKNKEFMVVAFSAHQPLPVDAIAVGRDQSGREGGVYVGEFILYDRELSDKERQDTEAYLMRKWLGKPHPESAAASFAPSYRFASEVDPVFDYSGDATVSGFSGGTGDVVKRGAGTVTFASLPKGEAAKTLAVEEGELVVPVNSFMDEALFHFDVQDEGSLVYTGGVIAAWQDVRRNGTVAEIGYTSHYGTAAPTLSDIETADGVHRNLLNFGSLCGSVRPLYINGYFDNVREAHVFLKGISGHFLPLTYAHTSPYAPGTTQHIDYYRDSTGKIIPDANASACVRNGYIAIDGVQHASSDIITPTDSMLMSFAPTANTYVNSIQGDRQMCGGAYVGEEIAFSRTLEPTERKYLEDLMLWKWKAVGEEPVWTNAYFAAVAVTNGATLSFTCAANPIVNALEGAGAINAIRLQDVTSVSAIGAELAAGDHLTVDGKVTFGDAVTVAISGSGLVFATPGDYTIIEAAGGLENVDLTSWTCDTSAFSSRRTYSLRQVGDTKVVLHVERKGAMIIVR